MNLKTSRIAIAALLASSTMSVAQDWSGPYATAGFEAGVVTFEDLSFGDEGLGEIDFDNASLTASIGYNHKFNSFIIGGEIGASLGGGTGEDEAYLLPVERGTSLSARVRLGYDAGQFLPYLTAGIVRTDFEADHQGGGADDDFAEDRAQGTLVGVGLDYRVNAAYFVRFEVSQVEYKDGVLGFYDGSDEHEYAASEKNVSLQVGFSF